MLLTIKSTIPVTFKIFIKISTSVLTLNLYYNKEMFYKIVIYVLLLAYDIDEKIVIDYSSGCWY